MLVVVIVQAVLLLVLLWAVILLAAKLRTTTDKASALLDRLDDCLTRDVVPAVSEARAAFRSVEQAAEGASAAVRTAEPVLRTVTSIARPVTSQRASLFIDGARLALSLLGVLREKKKSKTSMEAQEKQTDA